LAYYVKERFMNPKLRLLAVGVLTSLALTVPAMAKDATPK